VPAGHLSGGPRRLSIGAQDAIPPHKWRISSRRRKRLRHHEYKMEFRIADTFTDSLSRLTAEEQKAVKTAAFDLQVNPAHPSLQFHKLEKAKDPGFWSVRVTSDIRLIVHRTQAGLMLCYVNHHDSAYQWAERRRLETHPKTGAAQLVELRERVQEIVVKARERKQGAFSHIPDSTLLGYGIPPEWLEAVKRADEDSILTVAAHLPAEAAEAVLDLAVGVTPKAAERLPGADPFTHPDALRRFRVMRNTEELERALDYPWESGASFCILRSGSWWSGAMRVRRAWRARREQARPLSPCIAQSI